MKTNCALFQEWIENNINEKYLNYLYKCRVVENTHSIHCHFDINGISFALIYWNDSNKVTYVVFDSECSIKVNDLFKKATKNSQSEIEKIDKEIARLQSIKATLIENEHEIKLKAVGVID